MHARKPHAAITAFIEPCFQPSSKIPDGGISPVRFQERHPVSAFPTTPVCGHPIRYSRPTGFFRFSVRPLALTSESLPGLLCSIPITGTSSLIRAHAPVLHPLPSFALSALFQESLPRGRTEDLPSFDVSTFPKCHTPYAGRSVECSCPFLPPPHRPSSL